VAVLAVAPAGIVLSPLSHGFVHWATHAAALEPGDLISADAAARPLVAAALNPAGAAAQAREGGPLAKWAGSGCEAWSAWERAVALLDRPFDPAGVSTSTSRGSGVCGGRAELSKHWPHSSPL